MWSAEVWCQSVGVGQGEGAQGLLPAVHDGAFDQPAGGLALLARLSCARARARLSSMSRMASHSSLITASSLGKRPRFLMTFLSW